MITRVFRAKVPINLQNEFENKFIEISVPLVKSCEGLISVTIARPTKANPEGFAMISVWKDVDAIVKFIGEKWNEAHIPDGMEKYISECWVDHYENIDF